MVRATLKPMEEIMSSIQGYDKILVVGCGGCASTGLFGGLPEAQKLVAKFVVSDKRAGYIVVERQCDSVYFDQVDIADYDAIVSMSCGGGVQNIAEHFPNMPVFPAVNTMAVGTTIEPGVSEEKCRTCGNCVLAYTGGICPVTKCSKSLFNGPCGGADDSCEVDKNIHCAWVKIIERLSAQGRLSDLAKLQSIMEWGNTKPRTVVAR